FRLDTSSPPATPSFQDVPTTHWAYPAIEAIKAANFTAGCSASPPLFCPDASLTRGQLAVFAARGLALDTNNVPPAPYFADVPTSHPLFAFVQAVARDGIMAGCGGGNF